MKQKAEVELNIILTRIYPNYSLEGITGPEYPYQYLCYFPFPEQYQGQYQNTFPGDWVNHQKNTYPSRRSNHLQRETDLVYMSTSLMHRVENLTPFICTHQYGNSRNCAYA